MACCLDLQRWALRKTSILNGVFFTGKYGILQKKALGNLDFHGSLMDHSIIQNKNQKHEFHKKLMAASPEAIAFVHGHIEYFNSYQSIIPFLGCLEAAIQIFGGCFYWTDLQIAEE